MYSGKVKCINDGNGGLFIKNEIYEIKNGEFISGKLTGDRNINYTKIHVNFKDLNFINTYSEAKFEEVKTPMAKFNKEKILQPNTVVWCDTEEKANEFLKWADSEGYKWNSGKSYLMGNEWGYDKNETCYCIEDGTRCDVEYFKNRGFHILKYEDVIVPDKIKLLNEYGFEFKNETHSYDVNRYIDYTCISIFNTNNNDFQYMINFGKKFNTTIKDIQPILDALNIEIIEEPAKYTIDSDVEYTEEQVNEMEKLGLKFKKKEA